MAKQFLTREAGAVLNKKNRSALQLAFQTITSVLEDAGVIGKQDGGEDDTTQPEEDASATAKKNAAKSQKAAKTDKGSKDANSKEARSNSVIIHNLIEAGGFSYGDLAMLLQNALNDTRPESRDGEYVAPYRIVDIFDDYFVYCIGWSGSECYRVDYAVSEDGSVTLSPPIYVNRKVTYISPAVSDISASEAGEFVITEDYTRLAEAAIAADGTTLIKLIAPGMGSTGLYTPEVLQRDGATAFPKNTKMFWDHDTLAEEAARPEGTLTRLAAVTLEDARYIPDHRAGAGLYARAQVFESYRDDLNEIADYIGTSIRADGQFKIGDYNGARVPIITAIKPSNGVNNRVDFVTAPGAGGRVLSLFESARQRQPQMTQGDQAMTDEQIKKLIQEGIAAGIREAVAPLTTEVARLREASALREARAFADTTLAGPKYSTLPKTTRDRIAGVVSLNVPLTEAGAIDAAKLVEMIETAAKEEATYLSTATGRAFAIGLGESRAPGDPAGDEGEGDGDDTAEMSEMFARWGLTENAAKVAATGRVIR